MICLECGGRGYLVVDDNDELRLIECECTARERMKKEDDLFYAAVAAAAEALKDS